MVPPADSVTGEWKSATSSGSTNLTFSCSRLPVVRASGAPLERCGTSAAVHGPNPGHELATSHRLRQVHVGRFLEVRRGAAGTQDR